MSYIVLEVRWSMQTKRLQPFANLRSVRSPTPCTTVSVVPAERVLALLYLCTLIDTRGQILFKVSGRRTVFFTCHTYPVCTSLYEHASNFDGKIKQKTNVSRKTGTKNASLELAPTWTRQVTYLPARSNQGRGSCRPPKRKILSH